MEEIKLTPEDIEKIEKEGKEPEKNKELTLTPEMIEVLMKSQGGREEKKLEDVFGVEEATAKCLVELIKPDRINLLTDLVFEEIQALVVAEAFGDYLFRTLGSELLLTMTQIYKELKVSLGRRGRTEIVDLSTFVGGVSEAKKGRLPSLLPTIR